MQIWSGFLTANNYLTWNNLERTFKQPKWIKQKGKQVTNLKKSKRKCSKFNQFKASDCVFFLNEEWLTVAHWQLPGCESPRALPGLAFKAFAPIKVLTVRTVRSSVWVEVFVLQRPPQPSYMLCVPWSSRGRGSVDASAQTLTRSLWGRPTN